MEDPKNEKWDNGELGRDPNHVKRVDMTEEQKKALQDKIKDNSEQDKK